MLQADTQSNSETTFRLPQDTAVSNPPHTNSTVPSRHTDNGHPVPLLRQATAADGTVGVQHRQLADLSAPFPRSALTPAPYPDLDAVIRDAGVTTVPPFLLIGVLSSGETAKQRAAVRDTWGRFVTHTHTRLVHVKFILNKHEVRSVVVCRCLQGCMRRARHTVVPLH